MEIVDRLRRGDNVSQVLVLLMMCGFVVVVYVGGKLRKHLPINGHQDGHDTPQAKGTKEHDDVEESTSANFRFRIALARSGPIRPVTSRTTTVYFPPHSRHTIIPQQLFPELPPPVREPQAAQVYPASPSPAPSQPYLNWISMAKFPDSRRSSSQQTIVLGC